MAFTGTRVPFVAPHKEDNLQTPLEGPLSSKEWQKVRDIGGTVETLPLTSFVFPIAALLCAVLSVT